MTARLTLRLDLGPDQAVGPGKIRLLETVRDTGSISEAGRQLGMSYRRAWLLIADLNQCFREPVVSAQTGGARGGGASLTPFGAALVAHYRAIETDAHAAAASRMKLLVKALRPPGRKPKRRAGTGGGDDA